GRRDPVVSFFGPLLVLFLLGAWALSLVIGFGLMFQALADLGSVTGTSISDFFYLSGSTFFTLGLGDVTPMTSTSRALAVIEAGTGFGFLAMVIGYLPVFAQAFSQREIAISLLDSRA